VSSISLSDSFRTADRAKVCLSFIYGYSVTGFITHKHHYVILIFSLVCIESIVSLMLNLVWNYLSKTVGVYVDNSLQLALERHKFKLHPKNTFNSRQNKLCCVMTLAKQE